MLLWQWFLPFLVILVPLAFTLVRRNLNTSEGRIYFCDGVIETGLLLLVGAVPLILDIRGSNPGLIKTMIAEVVIFTMFLAWMGKSIEESRFSILRSPLHLPAVLFLWTCIASFFISPYRYASVKEIYKFFTYITLFLIVANNIRTRERVIRILTVALVSGAIVSLYGILQSYGYDFISWEAEGRTVSFLGNPNFLGGYLIIIIPLCLGMLFATRSALRKSLCLILLFALLLCLMWTLTRTSLIALLFGGLLFFILKLKRQSPRPHGNLVFRLCGATLLMVTIVIIAISPRYKPLKERVYNIFPSLLTVVREIPEFILKPYEFHSEARENTGVRMTIWQTAYRMFLERPLLGHGPGTLKHHTSEFRPSFYRHKGFGGASLVVHAHSEYFEVLAEQGLMGLLTFLWLALAFFRYGFKHLKHMDEIDFNLAAGGISAVFSCLFEGLASVSLRWTSTAIFFWFTMGLVVAIIKGVSLKAGDTSTAQPAVNLNTLSQRKFLVYVLLILTGIFLWGNAIKPFVSDLHLGRARKFMDIHSMPDVSIRECRAALQYEPTNISALYQLGYSYSRRGDWKEARDAYLRVVRLSPGYAQVDYNLGLIYYNLGIPHLAICHFKNTAKLDIANYEAHYMLGLCYSALREWKAAMNSFREAIRAKRLLASIEETEPAYPVASYNLGTIYYRLGRREESLLQYEEVLRVSPRDTDTLRMVRWIKEGRGIK